MMNTVKDNRSSDRDVSNDWSSGYFYESIEVGQTKLAEKMRILLYKLAPELFALVDYYDDNTFLEPLLFAYVVDSKPLVKLEQILFGYISENLRPVEIKVYANQNGIIELPRIGFLRTSIENRVLRLIWNGGVVHCALQDGEKVIDHVWEPPIIVEGTSIEVCRYNHPLLEKYFVGNAGKIVDVVIENNALRHVNKISKAFKIIQQWMPDYYEQIQKVTKRILVYSGDSPFSFATLSAHGIVFLNAFEDHDEVFFLEDLIHQCGHVIFSSLTLDSQAILRIAPDTPMKQLTGDERDNRDIYTTLHGVFTETWMNQCMDRCCDSAVFSRCQRHELLGRFTLILTRFGCDLRSLTANEIFTEKGLLLLSWFVTVYREIINKRYALLSQFDISNQSYCFSYESFLRSNPLMDD